MTPGAARIVDREALCNSTLPKNQMVPADLRERVFQAYGCRYAMHLDMNALEHTYFALYSLKDGKIAVQHLIEGMAEVDRKGGDELAPRFLSFPDDRDFFYLTRKQSSP